MDRLHGIIELMGGLGPLEMNMTNLHTATAARSEVALDIPVRSRDLYGIVQQEVEIGVHALKSEKAEMAVTLFKSALHKLTFRQPFYDHLVHNLLLSYKLRIEQSFEAGDSKAAAGTLYSALDLEIRGAMAEDAGFRQRFAGAFQEVGLIFFQNRQFVESVSCFRKAISICELPGSHINLSNALAVTGLPAKLTDFATDIEQRELGRHIFIACVPKSASSFLKNVLVGVTGYRDVLLAASPGQFEQEIYLPTLKHAARVDSVTQQHSRASEMNIQLMQAFGIRPVVLVRNIFDSVISLLDFYDNGAYFTSFFRADYTSLDRETRVDLLIDNLVPWYFQFVSSWSEAAKQKRFDVHWLTFEGLVSDKKGSIGDILKYYGLGAPNRAIEEAIKIAESEKRRTRFNRGVAGRGASGLTDRQKERIRRFADYYPSTDFSCIGL